MMKDRFMDIHHHLAYGVDDGPKNFREMQKMIKHAAREGIGTIIATPHVTPGVRRFHSDEYRKALADARAYCSEKGIELEILEGCEILYTDQTPRLLEEGQIPTLAGTDFVLVEFSPDVRYSRLREALDRIVCKGYRPVIAHTERYRCLTNWPPRARKLKRELDVFFQVNCSSIVKSKGWLVRRFLRIMLEEHLIDALGTDAHNMSSRKANMRAAWKALKYEYGSSYAKYLTDGSFMSEN